ncbi:MAG TPA: hypothetical protein VIH59_10950 [Candidatus Tectomicrobia bacterium]
MPHPHDQLGTTRLVAVQAHIDRGRTRHQPELCRVVYQVSDFRAADLVLADPTGLSGKVTML